MSTKRIIGIISVILGLSLIFFSFYIKKQVTQGRQQISSAEGTIKTGEQIFSIDPVSKEIGKEITKGVHQKLDEATQKANFYYKVATWIQIAGFVLVILGVILIIIKKKKKLIHN